MKCAEFEKFLTSIGTDLFSFAYILIPDDLQAGQLIIDSIQIYLIERRDQVELLLKQNTMNAELNKTKKELLRTIYELAKKRYQQLKLSINEKGENNDFYSLDFDEKAALFLKDKFKLNVHDLAFILIKTKSEVESYLYSSRLKMITKIPYEIYSEVVG